MRGLNIFNVVPQNFFNILASKNKEIYYDCLNILYELYDSKMGFDVSKEEAVSSLVDYFNNDEKFDEEEAINMTSRERANFVLDKLYQTGWISIDTDNDYNDTVSFRYYALTILEGFEKISTVEDDVTNYGAFEYRGYLFSIYSLLTKTSEQDYGLVINQVYRLSAEFVSEIKKINLKLKDYILSISKNTEIKDLMEVLIDYKTQLVDKSYQRLKTYDNVDRYKRRILQQLEDIFGDEVLINKIVGEYMIDKNIGYEEANYLVERSINETIDIFNNLDDLIDEIELKNKIYVNSTITKVKFLLNNETDTLGKLNYILKFISKGNGFTDNKLTAFANEMIHISNQKVINQASLYSPRMINQKFEPQKLADLNRPDLGGLTDEFMNAYDLEYSEPKILAYVDKALDRYHEVRASELFRETPTEDSLLKLLYVIVYGTTSEKYRIMKLDRKYETDTFILNDFDILRR